MRYTTVGLVVSLVLLLCWTPLAVQAQQPAKVPRLGVLRPTPASPCRFNTVADGLRELGYVEGHTLVIEWRCGDGTPERARELALELVQLPVDVFVGVAADGPLAAMQATRTIPIVFVGVTEPVAFGLVASLARPGGNVTGVTSQVDLAFHAKRLELLREAVPSVTRVGALQHGAFARALPARIDTQHAVEDAARALGIHLHVVEVDTPEELDGAFAVMTHAGAEALFVFNGPFFTTHRMRIVELALQHRLPGIFHERGDVVAGGLMNYWPNGASLLRRAVTYVDKILKGATPADLPVEQPTKFDLVINLKTAQALGLTLPPTAPHPGGRGDQVAGCRAQQRRKNRGRTDASRRPLPETAPNIALQPTPGSVRCAPAPWCG